MNEFDEYRFQDWVEEKLADRMALSKNYEDPSKEWHRVVEARQQLSAWELVCFLGEYLTLPEEIDAWD